LHKESRSMQYNGILQFHNLIDPGRNQPQERCMQRNSMLN
jgi:hypothetical protein